MAAGWTKAWLNGGQICGWDVPKPTQLAWVSADRGGAGTRQWFDLLGLEGITQYSLVDDPKFPIENLRYPQKVKAAFEYCLNTLKLQPGAHVIFDPVTPLFIAGDSNKARDVALSMLYYSRLCAERQINITLLGHFGKQRFKKEDRYLRPQDRIAGSNAFGGYTTTQIYLLDPEPEQEYWILGWVPRHGAQKQLNYIRDEVGLFVPYDEGEADAATEERATEEHRQALLRLIPVEPVQFSEVALVAIELLSLSRATLFRYRQQLAAKGLIEITARGFVRKL